VANIRTGAVVVYIPDPEKSVKENQDEIMESLYQVVMSATNNNYRVIFEVNSAESLDVGETDKLLDDAMNLSKFMENVDLETPVGIDEDGDPLFGMKKEK